MPTYQSTRGGVRRRLFRDALLQGLAPDGGLFVPDAVPALPEGAMRAGRFDELGVRVLEAWLAGEVAPDALAPLVRDALSFPVPLVPLGGDAWRGVSVLELFHGPTLSFKDFGARTMARLMGHFLEDEEAAPLTVLVATSGDTGSAVADGFAGQGTTRVVLLYPKGQVSPVQERQLIVERPGVQTLAVEGTFDDCQRLVKTAFADEAFRPYRLSSANSINVGRLLPQMLYYLWAAKEGELDEPVFCVPSGNLGNLTGGVLALLSGLPVRRFLAAHNANDAFPNYLRDEEATFGPSVRTVANAMDVGTPSNFERLRWLLGETRLRRLVWGTSVADADVLSTMRKVYHATGYLADPHTAVGLEAVQRYRRETGDEHPVVVLATAHPAKFPEIVERALGQRPEPPERLAVLWDHATAVETIPPALDALAQAMSRDAQQRLEAQDP